MPGTQEMLKLKKIFDLFQIQQAMQQNKIHHIYPFARCRAVRKLALFNQEPLLKTHGQAGCVQITNANHLGLAREDKKQI